VWPERSVPNSCRGPLASVVAGAYGYHYI
jgi:hypothetical protein